MDQNFEIYVTKWYTKNVTSFKAFLEGEVLLTTHLNFVTINQTQKIGPFASRHKFVTISCTGLHNSYLEFADFVNNKPVIKDVNERWRL